MEAEKLADILGGLGGAVRRVLWLPTVNGVPLSSGAATGTPPRLSPWQVEGLVLSPLASLPVLSRAARPLFGSNLRVAPDLGALARLLAVSLAVVARQSLVPSLKLEGGVRAFWQSIWSDGEANYLVEVARRLPASLFAVGEPEAPPRPDRRALVRWWVSELADAVVRRAGPVLPKLHAKPTPHDLWLEALVAERGELALPAGDVERLREAVQRWQRPLTLVHSAHTRLRLRLEEPVSDADGFRLTYLLQAVDDPSLVVTAEDFWQAKAASRSLLARRLPDAAEVLLGNLGRLSPLCPAIAASMQSRQPTGAVLTAQEAYRFLTEEAKALEQAGVQVLLPAWWQGGRRRLTLRARVQTLSQARKKTSFGLEAIAQVDWQVALGDREVSEDELRLLASLKAPLVRLRGEWTVVEPDEARRLLEMRSQGRKSSMTVRDVLGLALGHEDGLAGVPVASVEASGWVGTLLGRLQGKVPLAEEQPPSLFTGTLRPYQQRGYSWLRFLTNHGFGALLADDMGLGKTVQTLCLILRRYEEEPKRAFLLVCPTSLIGNWHKEAQRFAPSLPILVHHGPERLVGTALQEQASGRLVLTSYSLLAKDVETFRGVAWDTVVLDEAQAIKNPHTKAAEAVRTLESAARVALTGTPVENHVGDLWSIMEFLNPGLLGPLARFREETMLPLESDPHGPTAERLRRKVGPFLLRRLKTDPSIVPDLPEKLDFKVFCTLTEEQASLYRAVLEEMERELDEDEGRRAGVVLATLTRLKQVCNHPAHFLGDGAVSAERSGKLLRLTDMLEEVLAREERALIFTQFARMGELLQDYLQDRFGCEVLLLSGDTQRSERDHMVARFQAEEGPPLFVLTLKAGGTGLNLTRANHVFHYDRWWNPAVENQATDRAYRIGQTRTVEVHSLLCAGTLEERIDELLTAKREVAAQVVGSGEGWLARLDTDQLREILRLDVAVGVL